MSLDAKTLAAAVRKKPVLCVCGLASVIWLATLYLRSDLVDAQQLELDQKTAEGKRYRANIVNAAQLADQLEMVTRANRAVQERVMHPGDLAKNLQYFYRLEAETGVKYSDVRQNAAPAAAKAATGIYVPVNYTLAVQGDFPKIIAFLRRLEHGVYFCRLNTMAVTGTDSEVTLNLNIDLLGQP